MKKILVLLILICGQLFALDRDSTLKFYHYLFDAFSPSKQISVYTNSDEYTRVFSSSKKITLVSKPQSADLLLMTNEKALRKVLRKRKFSQEIDPGTILFVTDYRLLKISEEIVGAFYWKKGRSQLLFIKPRLEAKNITLPHDFKRFIVDEL